MLIAAPAFAQSIDVTPKPDPNGAGVELRITQVVSGHSRQTLLIDLGKLQRGTLTVASNVLPTAVVSMTGGDEQESSPPLRQLLDLIAVPSATIHFNEGQATLRRTRPGASSDNGAGLTPCEVHEFQAQMQRDADAALAKLKS